LSAKSPSEKLREIDVRLAEIESEKTRLLDRKKQLLATNQLIPSSRFSLAQKVEIFRRLFRGRTDVFATRWENAQGRSGYAVACHNEWVTGVCNKPKVKCGDCPNRHYKTLDEQVIYDHLAGKHVVGLYPLLPDSTCHFLAVDFDKDEWKDTVLALAHVCRQFDVPYAIEVSRSGNGAHLWIFFSEAIQAGLARRLGFGLLDKAMEIHAGLSFESYDRLFPNQDLMPEGGFGNLIALPLQQEKRQQGKTIFVDDHLRPIDDQWEFLAGLNVITTDSVDRLADDLAPQNLVVPLAESPFTEALSAETTAPWEQSLRIDHDKIPDCPRKIAIALSNHIYIKLSDIPAKLTARLRRVASFSNPVFFKKQCAFLPMGHLAILPVPELGEGTYRYLGAAWMTWFRCWMNKVLTLSSTINASGARYSINLVLSANCGLINRKPLRGWGSTTQGYFTPLQPLVKPLPLLASLVTARSAP